MSPYHKKCKSGKPRYAGYEEAIAALSEKEPGAVYFCQRCWGFHTTRRVQWHKRRGGGKSRRGSVRRPS